MASLNKVLLIGNLTRSPESKFLPSGTAIAEFGLAVNRKYTTESGDKKEEVIFVEVVFYGKTAEVVAQYITKGSLVFLEGRLHMEEWTDKTTEQKRSRLKIIGESIQFLDRKPQAEDSTPQAAPARQATPVQQRAAEQAPRPGYSQARQPSSRPGPRRGPGNVVQYAAPQPDPGDDEVPY